MSCFFLSQSLPFTFHTKKDALEFLNRYDLNHSAIFPEKPKPIVLLSPSQQSKQTLFGKESQACFSLCKRELDKIKTADKINKLTPTG